MELNNAVNYLVNFTSRKVELPLKGLQNLARRFLDASDNGSEDEHTPPSHAQPGNARHRSQRVTTDYSGQNPVASSLHLKFALSQCLLHSFTLFPT